MEDDRPPLAAGRIDQRALVQPRALIRHVGEEKFLVLVGSVDVLRAEDVLPAPRVVEIIVAVALVGMGAFAVALLRNHEFRRRLHFAQIPVELGDVELALSVEDIDAPIVIEEEPGVIEVLVDRIHLPRALDGLGAGNEEESVALLFRAAAPWLAVLPNIARRIEYAVMVLERRRPRAASVGVPAPVFRHRVGVLLAHEFV